MTETARCIYEANAKVAEGPFWDASSRRLIWVDIVKQHLNFLDPETKQNEVVEFDNPVSAAIPTNDDRILVCLGNSFVLYDHKVPRAALIEFTRNFVLLMWLVEIEFRSIYVNDVVELCLVVFVGVCVVCVRRLAARLCSQLWSTHEMEHG